MRSIVVVLAILCLLPTLSRAQEGADTSDPFLSLGESHQIHSAVLDEDRTFIVGLPASYSSSDESYPVLYLLDGPSNFQHTVSTTRFLAAQDRMPEVITIAIANTDRTRDLTPPTHVDSLGTFPTAGGADNFLKFIDSELKAHVEENYRTRPYSILIGHSFGGLFANHVLVHHPNVFNAYVSISPSLWWDEQRLVAQADSAFDHFEDLEGNFYMTMGNEGGEMLGGALKFAGVLEAKSPNDFVWDFELMEGETHGSVPLRSTYDGLEKIFDGWRIHEPIEMFLAGGLTAFDRHFKRIEERFGYERSLDGFALTTMGARALEDKNADAAEEIYTRMLSRNLQSAGAHVGLAKAHELMGHTAVAVEHFKHALEHDPRQEEARKELTKQGVDLSDYPEEVPVPREVLESYVGKYDTPDGDLEIVLVDGTLNVDFGGLYPMYAITTERFRLEITELYFEFHLSGSGAVTGFSYFQADEETKGKKVD